MKKMIRCCLIAGAAALVPGTAHATVVFDSIGPNINSFTSPAGSLFNIQSRVAFPFSPSQSGGITSVEAVLSLAGPAFEVPSNLRWEVWTRATEFGPPVTMLGTFAATPLPIIPLTPTPWNYATLTPSDGSIQLQAGQLYMLALARDGGAQIAWWSNGQHAWPYVLPYSTGNWVSPAVFQQAQIRISIPAAPSGAVLAAGGVCVIRRRRG